MIIKSSVIVLSKKNATVSFTPTEDVVPVGIRVLSPNPLHVSDIKVGACSQCASVTHFMSDMLASMPLRLDRTHGALDVLVYLYNDGDNDVDAEVELEAVPAAEAAKSSSLPLGFFDSPSRAMFPLTNMTQEPIAPGEVRKLAASTQVSGKVTRVFFSAAVDSKAVFLSIGTKLWKGKLTEHDSRRPAPGSRWFETDVDVTPEGKLELVVRNDGASSISARDFVAVVEEVAPQGFGDVPGGALLGPEHALGMPGVEVFLSTSGEVPPEGTAVLEHKPEHPFQLTSLMISGELGPHVAVVEIKVGDSNQMIASDSIPGVLFVDEPEIPTSIFFDVATKEKPLRITLRNTSSAPLKLGVTIKGVDKIAAYLDKILGQSPAVKARRNAVLEISPTGAIPPGDMVTCEISSQGIFRTEAVILDRPHLFRVLDVRVGNVSQLNPFELAFGGSNLAGINGAVLHDLARVGVALRIDTAQAGQVITLVVKNEGPEPAQVSGRLVGTEIG